MSANLHLTAKQSRFVQEYLVDGNGTRAAIAAGYGRAGARVAACRLLTKASVQKALQARQSADATRLSTQREDVIQGLLEAVDSARAKQEPMALIRAWAEIGRMMGFYAPEVRKVQARGGQADKQRRFETMTDAELLAIVAAA